MYIYIYIYIYVYIYIYIYNRLNGLASRVPSPPGQRTCQNCIARLNTHFVPTQSGSRCRSKPTASRSGQDRHFISGVHKGGFCKGGFSSCCAIMTSLLLNPPLLNPLCELPIIATKKCHRCRTLRKVLSFTWKLSRYPYRTEEQIELYFANIQAKTFIKPAPGAFCKLEVRFRFRFVAL